jgi:ribosomal protein L7/L12
MYLENIKIARNGFVLEDSCGNLHIASTLLDAARLAGESVPGGGHTTYESNKGFHDLNDVRKFFRAGQKIEAIKRLRDCFTPRLGLREAKDLVEQLCA